MNSLKDRHLKVIPKSSLACFEDTQNEAAEACAQITKEEMEKFGEQLRKKYTLSVHNDHPDSWYSIDHGYKTTSELLEIFLNQ